MDLEESKLNNLSPRELHHVLHKRGWRETDKSGGSHTLYTHPDFKNKVAVPRHKGFIRTGTLRSILKDADIRENLYNKVRYIVKEAEENKKQAKIFLGKNKTKVKIHPPLKEMVESKVLTVKELMKAVYFPEGVINDPDASSDLKNYAYHILQLRLGNT